MIDTLERNLIDRAKRGESSAFEELLKKYETKIFNLLLRMTGNKADASDLFQETFISAWKNMSKFRGDANFSTWLYRIAVNAVYMRHRKKKLKTVSMDVPVETEDGEMPREQGDWSTNPLATLQNDELRNRLEKSLQLMPETYRSVFVLSDMQGLPNDEIKNILKLSLPNVKSRLHRARLFMRRQFSDYFQKT